MKESGLAQLKPTLSQLVHKPGPPYRDLDHVSTIGDAVIKMLWQERHNITW